MMSRATLAAALWGELQRPFAEVGIVNTDTSGNLKEPLDKTLRAFDTAWGDEATGTIADGSEAAALRVAVYYGLDAVVKAFSKVTGSKNATTPGVSRTDNWSDRAKDLRADRAEAKAAALEWLPDDGASAFSAGTITMGFIEPVCDGVA